ncbi:MAG: D-alanine--D-alanine ligase family protein [Bacilli bacterium]
MGVRVAVIYGGRGAEREVSLMSGSQVVEALLELGYEVLGIDLTESFFDELRSFRPDIVFIGLHGRLGEDGTVQGALEVLGYPYVGSGVLASALAIDKARTKRFLESRGLKVALDVLITRGERQPAEQDAARLGEVLGWPYIIKPNREGSSLGLTLAHNPAEGLLGLETALQYDDHVLAEQCIAGMEVTVAVIGDAADPRILGVIEIAPAAKLYDYDSKYREGGSQHIIPARLNERLLAQAEQTALDAYRLIGCQDYARVDLIVGRDGPVLLEVNTLPGLTRTSLIPDAARFYGLTFGGFLDSVVQRAYQRAKRF